MSRKQKKMLVRILLAGGIFLVASVGLKQPVLQLAAFLLAYFLVGWDVLWKAIRNIARGQVFDENFLMTIATVGAFFTGEFPEGVAVMLFYQVGEWFQSYAVGKSRKSIAALMEIRPDYANVERDGALEKVDPAEVAVGDVIVIKAGEKIPLDGMIIEGTSSVDTAALTGEALPRDVACGDEVISGCVNQSGLLRVQVTKVFAESTVAKILDLVENAAAKKAKAEQFITKFARYYTPAVVGAALLLAVVPPLFVGGLAMWVHRALIFLVISCPCALVISVPLSFFGGIGGASKNGILIKGSNYIEVLARTKTIVFDKTGTLTKGTFRVAAVHPEGCSEAELLELTALAEAYSDHPISRSVREAYGRSIDHSRIASVQEHAGRGVEATLDGRRVCAGNSRLMEDIGAAWRPCHHVGTTVHVAIDGTYAGHIVIADEIKPDAKEAIAALKKQGVEDIVMLTGDTKEVGEVVAKALDIPRVRTQLLPADKVEAVEELLAQKAEKTSLAFVGDGINDAPVLSRADIGIAMGGMGSDAAIEAADVVLMDDCPSKISQAIAISKKTMKIVHQNIVFALAVKAVVLVLGACGYANMWAAVFADVGVSTLAILNAMRALKTK